MLDLAGHNRANQRGGRALVNRNPGEAAGQAGIAVENDDTIARRAANELDRAVCGRFGVRSQFSRGFARALDQHLDVAANEGRVLFVADLILDRQELVVAATLDVFWDVEI